MIEDDHAALFANIRKFGWDNNKRDRILREREIDFDDVRFVFDGPTIIRRSDRKGEVRYMVFGFLDDVEVVVICTLRGEVCWIISARRARRDERKKHHNRLPRRSAQGEDQLG
ncbi:MAG: BrnT family toxin [Deltaproteobacteria bacterium]|nr:BrnT family toxin [Deltaproteobacteria bacterium]